MSAEKNQNKTEKLSSRLHKEDKASAPRQITAIVADP